MNALPLSAHLHAPDDPEQVRVPAATYVSLAGAGAPGTEEFYRKKTLISRIAGELGNPASDPVVEIQYWYPDDAQAVEIADFYRTNPVPSLLYRVMVVIPEGTGRDEIAAVQNRLREVARVGDEVAVLAQPEQQVVQVMHHGPFAEEHATLGRLGAFAIKRGLHRSGPHHEIHLDAFGPQTPQDRLRTILRDPVE